MERIKWTKTLLGAILGIGTVWVISCGGGGNGSISVISPKYQGTYGGAAVAGDLATYTINGTTLTYRVQGTVFGNINGTLTLTPWDNMKSGFFWKNETAKAYIGVFKNVGFALVDTNNGTATIIGLHEPSSIQNFNFSTAYVGIKVYNDTTTDTWNAAGFELVFNATSKVARIRYDDGTTKFYSYLLNNNTNTIDLIDNTTNSTVAHILYKETTVLINNENVTSDFIAIDFTNGKGFAFGRDESPIKVNTNDTFNVYYGGRATNVQDAWWGEGKVYYNGTNWVVDWKNDQGENGTYTIDFNKYCLVNGTEVDVDGTACIKGDGTTQNAIIDPNNQVFVILGNSTGELYFEIGGW